MCFIAFMAAFFCGALVVIFFESFAFIAFNSFSWRLTLSCIFNSRVLWFKVFCHSLERFSTAFCIVSNLGTNLSCSSNLFASWLTIQLWIWVKISLISSDAIGGSAGGFRAAIMATSKSRCVWSKRLLTRVYINCSVCPQNQFCKNWLSLCLKHKHMTCKQHSFFLGAGKQHSFFFWVQASSNTFCPAKQKQNLATPWLPVAVSSQESNVFFQNVGFDKDIHLDTKTFFWIWISWSEQPLVLDYKRVATSYSKHDTASKRAKICGELSCARIASVCKSSRAMITSTLNKFLMLLSLMKGCSFVTKGSGACTQCQTNQLCH